MEIEDRCNILREMRICRFCLSNNETDLTNIYDRYKGDSRNSIPLPLQIMSCIAIEVFKNDGMPQLICSSCRNLTVQAYIFKTNCRKADEALKVFVATGQLSKPFLEKVDEMKITARRLRTTPQLSPLEITKSAKRIRMDDGVEIITLNLQQSPPPALIQKGTSITSDDDNTMDATSIMEDEENSNSNPSHIQTDCFSCPQCDRTFPLKQLLELHLPIHSREKNFECGECTRKFFTKYDLNKHMTVHSTEKPHDCAICHKSFSREALLRRHEKTVHAGDSKYECGVCEKTFLTKEFLEEHFQRHRKRKPFSCSVCNKSFVFKQGLDRHMTVHSENKPHKCNYCEASFTSPIKLTRHITSHAGLRPYPCKLCGRTFLLSHHLTRHMRSHYAVQNFTPDVIINQYKCDICSMSFRKKDSLINHSAIHSMVNLRCVICNTTFESAQMVKEHITTHLTDLPFPCDKCDYSFETQEQLEEHELKHAEMEYEEQIEKEVLSEALQGDKRKLEDDDMGIETEDLEEGEMMVTEYTIPDISKPDIVLRVPGNTGKQAKTTRILQLNEKQSQTFILDQNEELIENQIDEIPQEKSLLGKHPDESNDGTIVDYRFLKDEVVSDLEENDDNRQRIDERQEHPREEVVEPIKPIVRQEGTKVYRRKHFPIQRVQSEPAQESSIRLSSLQYSTEQKDKSATATKMLNTQLAPKVVRRVQKFIITKEEMKNMAKQGILEIKNGQVILKKQGLPILNAAIKPVPKGEIESLLDKRDSKFQQVKKYSQNKTLDVSTVSSMSSDEQSGSFTEQTSDTIIDLDDTFTDVSQTTLQGID